MLITQHSYSLVEAENPFALWWDIDVCYRKKLSEIQSGNFSLCGNEECILMACRWL